MKMGLNKADVVRYHKLLAKGHQLKYIARVLHTTIDVLKAKSPENVEKYKKEIKGRETAANTQRDRNRLAADVLSTTAAKVMSGMPTDPGAPATEPPADLSKAPTDPGTPKSEGTPNRPAGPPPM